MAGRLVRLLEAAVAAPERPIGSLDILAPAGAPHHPVRVERHGASDPACHPAGTVCRPGGTTPDAIAVVFEDATPELCASSMRAPTSWRIICAHSGSAPRSWSGLCVERSLEMIVGLLGILKAGGAYLPLDPAYPPERLAFMLEDAAAPVLVTQAALRDRLPAHAASIVRLDADWPTMRANPPTAPANRTSSATTPPTSSTPRDRPERPRASIGTHGGIANLIVGADADQGVRRRRRLLPETSIRRSLTPIWRFWPLISGGTAGGCAFRHSEPRSSSVLAAIVARAQVTRLITVPMLAMAL